MDNAAIAAIKGQGSRDPTLKACIHSALERFKRKVHAAPKLRLIQEEDED